MEEYTAERIANEIEKRPTTVYLLMGAAHLEHVIKRIPNILKRNKVEREISTRVEEAFNRWVTRDGWKWEKGTSPTDDNVTQVEKWINQLTKYDNTLAEGIEIFEKDTNLKLKDSIKNEMISMMERKWITLPGYNGTVTSCFKQWAAKCAGGKNDKATIKKWANIVSEENQNEMFIPKEEEVYYIVVSDNSQPWKDVARKWVADIKASHKASIDLIRATYGLRSGTTDAISNLGPLIFHDHSTGTAATIKKFEIHIDAMGGNIALPKDLTIVEKYLQEHW